MIGIRECRTLGFRHRGRRCRAQLLCSVQSSASRAEGAMRTRLTHDFLGSLSSSEGSEPYSSEPRSALNPVGNGR